MLLDLIVSAWVNKDYRRALAQEKMIGYRAKLNRLTPVWINGQMFFDMSRVWQAAGIAAQGVTYFTIGAVKNSYSSRFDYQSPFYQAWLGCYLVKFAADRQWQINDHFRLGIADQNTWLSQYGDPQPYTEVDWQHILKGKTITVGQYQAQLFEGSIFTHTDVGKGKRPFLFPLYMSGFGKTFNKSDPRLKLTAENLTPPNYNATIPLDSFQTIELHGYVAIIEISPNIKAVIFANGAIYQDKNGKKYNTFKLLEKNFIETIKAVTITKL